MGITKTQLTNTVSQLKEYVDNKSVNISSETGNSIETKEDGIYVAEVGISEKENNALSKEADGLYVPVQETTISAEDNNAIVKKEDGLFVENKTADIETLTEKYDTIKKYQKYLNVDMDSCYMRLSSESETYIPTLNTWLPFKKISGSLVVNDSGRVIIKSGQRVQIDITLGLYNSTSTNLDIIYGYIKDFTNNIDIQYMSPQHRTWSTKSAQIDLSTTCQYTNNTDTDCEIGFYITQLYGVCEMYSNTTTMTVHEIGRQTIIDPIEHANEKYGIEDTPVGHIISHMGTVAPKHYLICDGTEYNIMDYPYLAQHFIDQFGSVNYFGGDGSVTFCVPDLRQRFLKGVVETENVGVNEEAGLPNITGYMQAHGAGTATVIASAYGAFVGTIKRSQYGAVTNKSGATSFDRLNLDASRSSSVYGKSTTVTPKNTSVLYCIKASPTYYIQNYATKFQETTLWEGSAIIYCSTEGYITPNITFNLADSIKNYDRIEIRYGGYNLTTGEMAGNTFKQIIPSEISVSDNWVDVFLDFQFTAYYNMACKFSDEQTLSAVSLKVESPDSNIKGLKIYQIVGLKPAKPVYDVAINCDNDYSTEERIIGRWVDGKPLYQKTITTNIAITEQSQNTEIPEDSSGWDIVMIDNNHTILSITNNGAISTPFVHGVNSEQNIGVSFIKGNQSTIQFRTGSGVIGLMTLKCITLQYTKIADSVETTTRKSYSLDETLTGDTWIDDKPIYRKVIKCTSPSNNNTAQVISPDVKFNTIITMNGWVCHNEDVNVQIPINYYYDSNDFSSTFIDNNNIYMMLGHMGYTNSPVTLILEYTKSE